MGVRYMGVRYIVHGGIPWGSCYIRGAVHGGKVQYMGVWFIAEHGGRSLPLSTAP